jgi:hypothetical protein
LTIHDVLKRTLVSHILSADPFVFAPPFRECHGITFLPPTGC